MKTPSLLATILLFTSSLFAQLDWNTLGNNVVAGNFFGSTNNQPINFRTNNTQRMALMGNAPAGSITGALGLGTITPLSFMHVSDFSAVGTFNAGGRLFRTDGLSGIVNQWQFFTGTTTANATQKFRVFTTVDGTTAPLNNIAVNLQNITLEASQRDLIFNAGGNMERMRILGQDHVLNFTPWFATARKGNVGIGTANPLTRLHIGGEGASGAGWRTWMDIGTFYGSPSGLDNMYVGLKIINSATTDAIINWGDNPSPFGGDRLRFIFTSGVTGGTIASSANGLQIAHMWANSYGDGRMAIGDFQTPGLDPNNTLEIRASSGSPYWNDPSGTSGLRFSFLTSANTAMNNPGNGVLSVDANGDIIYVQADSIVSAGGGGSGFTSCTNTTGAANLNSDSKVNLNSHNLYFEGQNNSNDKIGIGYNCSSPLNAKLDLLSENGGIGGNFWTLNGNNTTGSNIGVWGYSGGNGGNSFGVLGRTGNSNSSFDAAIFGSPSSSSGWGGYFTGDLMAITNYYPSDSTLKTNIQPLNEALNTINNLRPKTYFMDNVGHPEYNFNTNVQYGFLSQDVQSILPDLVKTSPAPLEFDSAGNILPYSGNTFLAMNYIPIIPINTAAIQELDREFQNRNLSDQSIKTNVVDLNNSLTKVLAMRGVSYDWTAAGQNTYSLDTCNHVGFIAQELQQVDNRLTFIGRDSLLHVEYEKVVPILVEAIEELNNEVESKDSIINAINSRLTTLENCLSGILPFLCQLSQSAIQANTPETQSAIRAQLAVKLNNNESIILDQNVPNPFAEQTVINFSIPESVQKAQIHFYNTEGRIIQSVEISERGLGSLTVFGSDLSRGIYTYTLVADGQIVSTKKMMKD